MIDAPTVAWTRAVSLRIAECELTHLERTPIDPERARRQHAGYEEALSALGLDVRRLPELPDHPDGVFVEDAAVILDEVVVITRPGAASRRAEVDSMAAAIAGARETVRVPAPATLDGGDVLVAGRTVWVGASGRTNAAAHRWLGNVLVDFGYDVRVVPVRGCLHLKSAVTLAAPDAFLLNPAWVPVERFGPGRVLEVDPAEPRAANVLQAGGRVLCAAGAPRTRARLEALGLETMVVDISELARAEAGVTCCSVLVPPRIPTAAPSSHIPGRNNAEGEA